MIKWVVMILLFTAIGLVLGGTFAGKFFSGSDTIISGGNSRVWASIPWEFQITALGFLTAAILAIVYSIIKQQ